MIYDYYYKGGKVDLDVLKILYGSNSFEALAVKATKVGKMMKQGGSNEKKWESRVFVLIDNWLV